MAALLLDEGISRDLAHQLASQGFAASCWQNWGLGDHHGIIAPRQGKYHAQLPPPLLLPILIHYRADASSFANRIEYF